jgi:hypothetical protein
MRQEVTERMQAARARFWPRGRGWFRWWNRALKLQSRLRVGRRMKTVGMMRNRGIGVISVRIEERRQVAGGKVRRERQKLKINRLLSGGLGGGGVW